MLLMCPLTPSSSITWAYLDYFFDYLCCVFLEELGICCHLSEIWDHPLRQHHLCCPAGWSSVNTSDYLDIIAFSDHRSSELWSLEHQTLYYSYMLLHTSRQILEQNITTVLLSNLYPVIQRVKIKNKRPIAVTEINLTWPNFK